MKSNKGLNIFIVSQFIALVGERISSIAFISLASEFSPSTSSTSTALIGAFQILPIIIFSFIGGYFADKYARGRVLLVLNSIRICTILFVIMTFALSKDSLMVVYFAVFILGLITSLYNPTKKSFVPFLVENNAAEIERGNWYLTISEILAMLVGIGIGTLLLNFLAPKTLLIFDALFFLVSIAFLFFLPKIKPTHFLQPLPFLAELKGSLKIIKTSKPVFWLMFYLVMPFYVSSGLFYAASSKWAAEVSPENTGEALGRLFLVLAVGAILSYFVKGLIKNKNDYSVIKYLFLLNAISIAGLAFSSTDQIVIAYFFTFITGVFVGLLYPRTIYLFQLYVDKSNIGKITSLNEVIFSVSFVTVVLLSVVFEKYFSYRSGWAINSGFLLIIFLISRLKKPKQTVIEK